MAPARNAVDSETQKEIVLQVGPKNRYFPLSSNAAGATFIIVAVQESTRSGETRGPRERSAPRATVYKTTRRGLTPAGAASGRCALGWCGPSAPADPSRETP